jgi:23S rRNA (cytidine1920-2'-O)/16S rRNA (cytidine1409-2'-O)-methyltransferase
MPTVNAANNFVSRAEGKLEGAVRAFHYDFRNKTVLDIGSSTGGFTELALKLGAKKVVAVEKGTRQMKAPLRFDPRVELHEKTDFFDFANDAIFDTILADVSFVSLKKILLAAKKVAVGKTDFLVMLKPQFEARAEQLFKGVVKNEKIRREIVKDFENWLKMNGFVIMNKRDNEVLGKNGNKERFYYLKLAKKS